MLDISQAPFPITTRELWLPRAINNNATLPSSKYNGHPLTLTGARKGTTCEGVHFTGAVTSNINCGALHNASAKLWISFRFKLDQPYTAATPINMMLFGKKVGGGIADCIRIYFALGTGQIMVVKRDGGVDTFLLWSVNNSWDAGVWYHLILSISSVNGARLLIDNNLDDTDPDVSAVCNGGNFVIGDEDDPGAGIGFKGIIADFFCEEGVDLTANQEADLYHGIPPATVDNAYPLDEGRGVIAYDRGADGNNGTLDTTATWAWGACRQSVISFDGINDRAVSSIGVDISNFNFIWVSKVKSTYDSLSRNSRFAQLRFGGADGHYLGYQSGVNAIEWGAYAVGGNSIVRDSVKHNIDDYIIYISNVNINGVIALYRNGFIIDKNIRVGALPIGGSIVTIGCAWNNTMFDISKPLMVALVNGAFTPKQAKTFSRWLDNELGLGLNI